MELAQTLTTGPELIELEKQFEDSMVALTARGTANPDARDIVLSVYLALDLCVKRCNTAVANPVPFETYVDPRRGTKHLWLRSLEIAQHYTARTSAILKYIFTDASWATAYQPDFERLAERIDQALESAEARVRPGRSYHADDPQVERGVLARRQFAARTRVLDTKREQLERLPGFVEATVGPPSLSPPGTRYLPASAKATGERSIIVMFNSPEAATRGAGKVRELLGDQGEAVVHPAFVDRGVWLGHPPPNHGATPPKASPDSPPRGGRAPKPGKNAGGPGEPGGRSYRRPSRSPHSSLIP